MRRLDRESVASALLALVLSAACATVASNGVSALSDDTSPGELMVNEPALLFDFTDPAAAERFVAVDDRVMGGVSRSRLRSLGETAVFEGDLSTEQNGGFASVRSDRRPTDLSASSGIVIDVRGDGRTYKLRMRTDASFDGVSYQTSFASGNGEWRSIRIPFADFRPTFRGRPQPQFGALDPSAVQSFGLLVADGQVGSFALEIRSIGTYTER